MKRCAWVSDDPLYVAYHDKDWGVPVHDDQKLFEMLTLEGAQAGLSWITVLKRRENYREAFDNFDAAIVARYGAEKVEALLQNPGIIRHKQKVISTIKNAECFSGVQAEYGSFDKYIWKFVGGQPIQNTWTTLDDVPTETDISRAMSKDLKARGFSFVGPTICYAFMQACGLVNDHTTDCFRREQVKALSSR